MEVTREDVERAIHKARSLVTVKPLPDDMAVVSGPRGRDDRPRALRKVRGMVKRQQLDIALGSLPLDGVTWRTKARILHRMGKGSGMLDAVCEEMGITGEQACN